MTNRATFRTLTEWLRDRRAANRLAERRALLALADAVPGTAHDVPIAGATWPGERLLDADTVDVLRTRHRIDERHYRLRLEHHPRVTTLRIRALPDGSAHRFATALCAASCERAEQYLAQRYDTAHLSFLHPGWCALIAPDAPPFDPAATACALAAHASATLLACPIASRAMLPGNPTLDVALPPHCTIHTPEGRAALRAIETELLPSLGSPVPSLHAAPRGWQIGGFTAATAELRTHCLHALEHHRPPAPSAPAPKPLDTAHTAHIGLNVLHTLAQLPPDATPAALTRALATRHGLAGDPDPRIKRFAHRLAHPPGSQRHDFLLVLDHLASFAHDPALVSTLRNLVHT